MRTKKTLLVLLLLGLLVLAPFGLHVGARVQYEKATEPFATVPAELRPQLWQRLKIFISLQGKRQWGKMYDLSIERVQRSSLTKDEFIKEQLKGEHSPSVSTVLEFTPQSATLTNEHGNVREWTIDGCAKYLRKRKVVYLKAGLKAGLSNQQWYLSNLYTTLDAVDGPERFCTPRDKTSNK